MSLHDAGGLRDVIDIIRRVFPLRTCKYEDIGIRYHRPCLQYHIKRCVGPCVEGYVAPEAYAEAVGHVRMLLECAPEQRETAERVHGFYAPSCPVYRSIHPQINVTTELVFR